MFVYKLPNEITPKSITVCITVYSECMYLNRDYFVALTVSMFCVIMFLFVECEGGGASRAIDFRYSVLSFTFLSVSRSKSQQGAGYGSISRYVCKLYNDFTCC